MEKSDNKTVQETDNKQAKAKFKKKGKRNFKRNADKADYKDKVVDAGTINDPAWYGMDQPMLAAAANLPFTAAAGRKISYPSNYSSPVAGLPGIFQINYIPTMGYSNAPTSALNIATKALWNEIRKANSGAKNYQSSDVGLILCMVDSMVAMHSWLLRTYATAMKYSQLNLYEPTALMAAEGIPSTVVDGDLSKLRWYILKLGRQINRFALPSNYSIIARHSFLNLNVFRDSDTFESQYYVFKPYGFYKYVETSGAGKCEMTAVPTFTDVDSIISYCDGLIGSIFESEDFQVISADIRKAFTDNELLFVPDVPVDLTLEPVYSKEVLAQIENAVLMPIDSTTLVSGSLDIIQNPLDSTLIYTPQIKRPSKFEYYGLSHILNAHSQEVTHDDVMEMTRLVAFTDTPTQSGSDWLYDITTFGTEIVCGCTIYYNTINSSGDFVLATSSTIFGDLVFDSNTTIATIQDYFMRLGLIENFDWHPDVSVMYGPDSSGNWIILTHGRDYDNYYIADKQTINRLHDTAVMSELNVPIMGNFRK